MESDQHGLSYFDGGGSQIAGRAEHQFRECIIVRAIFPKIDFGYFLPLSDQQFGHSLKQRKGFFSSESLLFCIHFFSGLDIMRRKKLLRTSTRCSALAVIPPVSIHSHVKTPPTWVIVLNSI